MKKDDSNVLQKPENVQFSIANSTTNPDILDSLANSPYNLVRMTAVANPAIRTEILKEKVDDEDAMVRWETYKALKKRDIVDFFQNNVKIQL